MHYEIVKLNFSTPLHLSRGQTDAYDKSEEILHSDTIKSAIFVIAKMLFGQKIDNDFFKSFTVSSAFPFKNNEYFFPKPMAKLPIKIEGIDKEKEESKLSKGLKKIEFFSKEIFEKIINAEEIEIKKKQLSKNKKFVFATEIESDEEKNIYKSQVQQRLKVEYVKDGTPYYIDRIYFTENSGLYFLINYKNADKEKIKSAIRLLGDEGIGTDKHVGNGIFVPEFSSLELNIPENAEYKMLLSLYCPTYQEIKEEFLKESSYALIKRGGYIASPENINNITLRKKSVFMFKEASVFPREMNISGKIVDLRPEKDIGHSVWRDGQAFAIPFIKTDNYE